LAPLAGYTTPKDGYLVIYVKPGGSFAQTNSILSSFALNYTS
jgi:hypothetical protein